MLVFSSDDLLKSEKKILKYVSNKSLIRHLNDSSEVTLLLNFHLVEMVILSLPVLVKDDFIFKRVLLVIEKDSGSTFLFYRSELLSNKSFENFISNARRVVNAKFSLLKVGIRVYFDCVDFLDARCEEIEQSVVEERYVARNIVSLMRFDTILQQARPNVEGIGIMVDELVRINDGLGENRDVVIGDDLLSLRLDVVQVSGLLNGLGELIDNVSNSIDSINNFRLNRVMRTLTVVTVCLAIPTLVAGIFGMNIPLPFAEEIMALPGIIGVSILVVVLVIMLFKGRRYF